MNYETDYVVSETENILIQACQAETEDLDSEDSCAYYFRIENNSDSRIQIVGKEVNITDEHGDNYRDFSDGFKGELPLLEPGEYFEYADTAPLHTALGVLYGTCKIISEGASQIKNIRLPALNLVGPSSGRCLFQ
jgi:ApaG protein